MKKIRVPLMIALCAITLFASCATKPEQVSQIPTPQATTAQPETKPQATPDKSTAPVAVVETKQPAATPKAETSSKTVITVSGTMPEAKAPAKAPTLAERIASVSEQTSVDEINQIIAALEVPANDPDGKLTQQALAKAQEVATKILSSGDATVKANLFAYATKTAQTLIDSTYSVDTLQYYKGLLASVQGMYGSAVDTSALVAQADERIAAINSYYKNSIYTYLRAYPKGRYVKELAAMLTKYPVKNPTK